MRKAREVREKGETEKWKRRKREGGRERERERDETARKGERRKNEV